MHAPHRAIEARSPSEELLVELLDSLWERYRGRVAYARRYEELIESLGAVFRNDHIAFRTIASQEPSAGIASISRLFEALGYSRAGCYDFPAKRLGSVHFRHSNPGFPKLFVSELRLWELSENARRAALRTLRSHRPPPSDDFLAALRLPGRRASALKREAFKLLTTLPWDPPQKKDAELLDRESQFGAWVLLNGYEVNHFTASVDAHGAAEVGDIEKTVAAMRAYGIPMKGEIEGARGASLRQSSTEAAVLEVAVRDGARKTRIPWPYAYFEIAERPLLRDPKTGKLGRFEGFLGGQAAALFEMTARK